MFSSAMNAVGSSPRRADSPATTPVPASRTAGTASHLARPMTAPTSRPMPHTAAAAPSHCSGWRRPPLAWSMSAPPAATTAATPSVARPSTDGTGAPAVEAAAGRPRRARPARRPAGREARAAGTSGLRARRGCHRASASPTRRTNTAHPPLTRWSPFCCNRNGRPPTRRTPPAILAVGWSAPRTRTSQRPRYSSRPTPPTIASSTNAMRSHRASIPRRAARREATPPRM